MCSVRPGLLKTYSIGEIVKGKENKFGYGGELDRQIRVIEDTQDSVTCQK